MYIFFFSFQCQFKCLMKIVMIVRSVNIVGNVKLVLNVKDVNIVFLVKSVKDVFTAPLVKDVKTVMIVRPSVMDVEIALFVKPVWRV